MTERRRPKRKGRFLLGTLLGAAAGIAGGLALLRGSADQDGPSSIARAAGSAEGAIDTAARAPRAAAGGFNEMRETLTTRWNTAMREGKQAAQERRMELELQLNQERRVPVLELEGKLDEAMGEKKPDPPAEQTTAVTKT